MPSADNLFLGIDLGTSQCRVAVIDAAGTQIAFAGIPIPPPERAQGRIAQDPEIWWRAVTAALDTALASVDAKRVRAIAVDGTSGTLLLTDAAGTPLTPALMYNDQSSTAEAARIAAVAPGDSAARGASSALAKLLQLAAAAPGTQVRHALHQADWIAGRLRGRFGTADENNALKLGYDPVTRRWPAWMANLGIDATVLPDVVPAGTDLGIIDAAIADRLGMARNVRIVAGTTDSVAASLAAGIAGIGDAVTSLGSTLVLKVASQRPVADAAHGIYTHRIGDWWLAGGASNAGGAALATLFSPPEIESLSARIDPDTASSLDLYPLPGMGERFPVADPAMAPRLTPRPDDDAAYLHGLLESLARIERDGYRLLERLGAPYPRAVRTAGGGARNTVWTRIRARVLGVDVIPAVSAEAAHGAALLALRAVPQ